jgi:hypothetical protein
MCERRRHGFLWAAIPWAAIPWAAIPWAAIPWAAIPWATILWATILWATILWATLALVMPTEAADIPAAIVMEVTGTADPPLSPMSEIAVGTTVKLGDGASLTFLDYARCKMVTVVGGTVTLGSADYRTTGRIENEADGPCPQTYSTAGGGTNQTTGGLIVRGGLGPPRWPVNAQFLLTGPNADRVRAAAIYPEDSPDAPVSTLNVGHSRMTQAPGLLPPPNTRYMLRLTTADAEKVRDITFVGIAPTNPPPFIVLRVN